METRNIIKANFYIIASLVSALIIGIPSISGFDLRPLGYTILILAVLCELRRRTKETVAQKARFVESIVNKRVADFTEKFSSVERTSVLWVNASSECKFGPSSAWSKYQKCFSKQQERKLKELDDNIRKAATAHELNSLLKCFVEVFHITSDYYSFLTEFREEFSGRINTDAANKWMKSVIDEYNNFTDRLEEDLRGVQTQLNTKLDVPWIRKIES